MSNNCDPVQYNNANGVVTNVPKIVSFGSVFPYSPGHNVLIGVDTTPSVVV